MVPKADSGAFLLLFLLVLTVTEPLRPGARRGGRGGAGGWGRGGWRAGLWSPRTSFHPAGPRPGRAPAEACLLAAASPARVHGPPGPCCEFTWAREPHTPWNFVLERCCLWIHVCGALRVLRLTEARVMCGARPNFWGLGILWPRG